MDTCCRPGRAQSTPGKEKSSGVPRRRHERKKIEAGGALQPLPLRKQLPEPI